MNTKNLSCLKILPLVGMLLAPTACRTVETGPGLPPDPNQRGVIYGTEPAPASIPQKDIPAGESSLRKKGPDKRIDQ
jgi:hypothetical protein